MAIVAIPIGAIAALPANAIPPIGKLGDLVACGPSGDLRARTTGGSGARQRGGSTSHFCIDAAGVETPSGLWWPFLVGFEICFSILAVLVVTLAMRRARRR